MKVWGYKARVLFPKPLHYKINAKTWECKFIGYIVSIIQKKKKKRLIESKDVAFLETIDVVFPFEQIMQLEDTHFTNKKQWYEYWHRRCN